MAIPPGTEIDRFVVVSLLGEGGTATVYRVRHRSLGSEHALKLLHSTSPSHSKRLLREGRLQSRLQHPGLVPVTDVITHQGRAGLVMEFIDGPSLEDWLKQHGPMPYPEGIALFRRLADALQTAHDADILHRDIKPANVLLDTDEDGTLLPRITDFGIAKAIGEDGTQGHTRAGLAMGTPGYMAPEQWADASSVTVSADVFAAGVLLYELLSGTLPYAGERALDILNATTSGDHTPLHERVPSCPVHVSEAVTQAIHPDPAQRTPSIYDLCEALKAPPPQPARTTLWRTGALLALALLVAGVVTVGGISWALRASEPVLPTRLLKPTPPTAVAVGGLWMDRTEVTRARWQTCLDQGACTGDAPTGEPDLPVVGVTWIQAGAFCAWAGGRLPTEEEWDAAAFPDGAPWPWGDAPLDCTRANIEGCDGALRPVEATPAGASADGVRDLIGNAWEWTATEHRSRPRLFRRTVTGHKVIKGGSFQTAAADVEAPARYHAHHGHHSDMYSLRCVYDEAP